MPWVAAEGDQDGRPAKDQRFAKGGTKDVSNGPVKKRRCTDVCCTIIFVLHWLVFVVVTLMGVKDGDPKKLYRPRDYRGGYCGVANSGLEGHGKLLQTLNVTSAVDTIAKQLVCSSTAQEALLGVWGANSDDYNAYLCACCLTPCIPCSGSLDTPDLSNPTDLQSAVTARMAQLTDPAQAAQLFTPGEDGLGSIGADLMSEATKYFIPVCLSGTCAITGAGEPELTRSYTYSPSPDAPWKAAWDRLAQGLGIPQAIQDTLLTQFTFQAISFGRCPYAAKYCVPMPGVRFAEIPGDYCKPKLETQVISAIGSAAAEALEGLSASAFAESAAGQLGNIAGDVLNTLDALAVVAFWSFVVGLLFMVLLRFFVGCVIWATLMIVFVLLLLGGGASLVRSQQCVGSGFFETGRAGAVSIALAAQAAADSQLSGGTAVTSEEMTGNGADYRGRQQRSRSGHLCQRWDCVTTAMAAAGGGQRNCTHDHNIAPSAFPSSDLVSNYCRNPANASSIWCFTTNPDARWELCTPIGVILADCPQGYAVSGQQARKALEICGYVSLGFAGVWFLLVILMYRRIKLAIRINKVAAMFVYHAPAILFVPVAQIIVGMCYCLFWVFCASFLLSQVPVGYTPDAAYATYAEAYGTDTTPGACTDKWPTGFVWRDEGNLNATDDPCSGNLGDTTGMTPRCWRCAPPRYALDVRFAFSFFSFLWNNAFLIAMGQCIVAGACATWFFAPHDQKAKRAPVLGSVRTVFRYHLGSLAFGSFIIAVVQFIRYLMKYFEKQAEAQKNKILALVLKVVQCCILCFERFLKFLNKNAYIQIALMGTSFCKSAKEAFFLILRNAARFGTLAILGAIIHFIGFSFIVVATSLMGYFLLQALHPDISPLMPVLTYVAMGYVVAKLFMNVFGLSVDTLLQCFIAAEEMQDVETFVPRPLLGMIPGGHSKKAGVTFTKVMPVAE